MVAALALASVAAHAQDGVTKTSIVLGQSVALTGPGSALAVPFHQGAKLYFDRVNAAGGVNGRKIDLVTLDDRGNAQLTAANTKKLLEQGVLSLFGYYGSPQVTAAYPHDQGRRCPAVRAHGRGRRVPRRRCTATCIRCGRAMQKKPRPSRRHAETLGAKRLAILHGNDSESLAALDSATRTMSSMGANVVANAAMSQRQRRQQRGQGAGRPSPSRCWSSATANSAAGAVRDLRAKGFRGPIYGFSNTGESLLAEELGPAGAGVVVVRVVPKSDTAKVAVVRDLLADAQAAKLGKPNVYMLEGYIAARVYAEALRRMPARPQPRAS